MQLYTVYIKLNITDVQMWLGFSVVCTALISWSIPSSTDLVTQLECTGALANIMASLQYVCVQDLSEVNDTCVMLVYIIWKVTMLTF